VIRLSDDAGCEYRTCEPFETPTHRIVGDKIYRLPRPEAVDAPC
jgi:hypothetical protein